MIIIINNNNNNGNSKYHDDNNNESKYTKILVLCPQIVAKSVNYRCSFSFSFQICFSFTSGYTTNKSWLQDLI